MTPVPVSQDLMSSGNGQLGSTCPTTPVTQATLTLHGSAFPLLYWPKYNHVVRDFYIYSSSWYAELYEGMLQSHYLPFSQKKSWIQLKAQMHRINKSSPCAPQQGQKAKCC